MNNYVNGAKLEEFAQKFYAKQNDVFALKTQIGLPLIANTVAGMTDQTKIYIYVGSEAGYISGNWYYYNGSEWVSGGEYVSYIVTPQQYGAKADGVTDDTTAVQNALNSGHIVFFPEGVYLVTQTLIVTYSIYGVAAPRMGGKGSIIKAGFSAASSFIMSYTAGDQDSKGICINDISFDCDSKTSGFSYQPSNGRPPLSMDNVSVWNHANIGISINPQGNGSRFAALNNISITGGLATAECNIYVGTKASDCTISNFILMYCKKGIINHGGGLRLVNGHAYIGRSGLSDEEIETYYSTSIGIESYANTLATNIYVDSALQGWVQREESANIGTLIAWYDNFADRTTHHDATIVRGVDSTTHVHVGSLLVGGNRSVIGDLINNNVSIGKTVLIGWSELPNPTNGYNYGQLPLMTGDIGASEYSIDKTSENQDSTWFVVAAVYFNSAGVCVLRMGRNQLVSDITIKYDGSNISAFGAAVNSNISVLPVQYKIVGKVVYLYIRPYGIVTVRQLYATNSEVCGVDLNAMPDLSTIKQLGTDGLTQIL